MLAVAAATGKERDEEVKVGRELAGSRSRRWQGRSTSAQGWQDYASVRSARRRPSRGAFALADAAATDEELDKELEGEAAALVVVAPRREAGSRGGRESARARMARPRTMGRAKAFASRVGAGGRRCDRRGAGRGGGG